MPNHNVGIRRLKRRKKMTDRLKYEPAASASGYRRPATFRKAGRLLAAGRLRNSLVWRTMRASVASLRIARPRPCSLSATIETHDEASQRRWRLAGSSVHLSQGLGSGRFIQLQVLSGPAIQECVQDLCAGNGRAARRDGQRARIVPRGLQEVDSSHGCRYAAGDYGRFLVALYRGPNESLEPTPIGNQWPLDSACIV
jgi:hypothetical protein